MACCLNASETAPPTNEQPSAKVAAANKSILRKPFAYGMGYPWTKIASLSYAYLNPKGSDECNHFFLTLVWIHLLPPSDGTNGVGN
jgi:hypothetical protein